VIDSIFGATHHSELISRSEYVLKVLSRSKIGISEEEMNIIWNLTKRDNQTKSEIFSLLQTVGESLGKEFIEFIMEKILAYKHLSSSDLNFMYSFKNKSTAQNECTWKILNDSENYPEDVIQTAYEKIIDNVKFAAIEKKLSTITE